MASTPNDTAPTQLALVADDAPEWWLDDVTREIGKAGVANARRLVARARSRRGELAA